MAGSSSKARFPISTSRAASSASCWRRSRRCDGRRWCMSLHEEVDMLRRIPLFSQIEPPKLKLIAFTSERVAFDAGHTLFHQGDAANAAYIIIEGKAEVIVEGAGGPVVVAVLGPNDFFGEIAILCDVPRTASVRANTRLVT